MPRYSAEAGRLTGISDRGQRSTLTYEARGTVSRTARIMAYIPAAPVLGATAAPSPAMPAYNLPAFPTDTPTAGTRTYDETHVYVRTARYDNAGKLLETVYPTDPDWVAMGGNGTAPVVKGDISYNKRGLPSQMRYRITYSGPPSAPSDITCRASPSEMNYRPDGALHSWKLGDYFAANGTTAQAPTTIFHLYDVRRRLRQILTSRTAPTDPTQVLLNELNTFLYRVYVWDAADNLTGAYDLASGSMFPAGHKPAQIDITHDALYRVTGARYQYQTGSGYTRTDTALDWRSELTSGNTDGSSHAGADPMRGFPAPMVATNGASRVKDLQWRYDWLGNMTRWDEDDPTTTGTVEPTTFYERGLGRVANGNDLTSTTLRPSALYVASNLPTMAPGYSATTDRGGWLELDYGVGGNVISMTVHARCFDVSMATVCYDAGSTNVATRKSQIRSSCVCEAEQHYQYRWDELNRLHEARRYDRTGGSGNWYLNARQRYRYDAANERAIKESLLVPDGGDMGPEADALERVTLYVYPGDFERRGVERNTALSQYDASATLGTETQYLIAGNRIVWQRTTDPLALERRERVTHAVSDLLGSTSAVIDIDAAELISLGSFYPNGAQEHLWTQHTESLASEPLGFTGKEEDAEVGLTYFGHRYLTARAGRWTTPDPLSTHAVGGGEPLNSFHYIAGNFFQARDPDGLDCEGSGCAGTTPGSFAGTEPDGLTYSGYVDENGTAHFTSVDLPGPDVSGAEVPVPIPPPVPRPPVQPPPSPWRVPVPRPFVPVAPVTTTGAAGATATGTGCAATIAVAAVAVVAFLVIVGSTDNDARAATGVARNRRALATQCLESGSVSACAEAGIAPPGSTAAGGAAPAAAGGGGSDDGSGRRGRAHLPGRLGQLRRTSDGWESTAGIRYSRHDPVHENRVRHVTSHAVDNANRAVHSVFRGGPRGALDIVDRAWLHARATNLAPRAEGGYSVYDVPMNHLVHPTGYAGGSTGAASGNPALHGVRIVMRAGTSEIITAYPIP